MPVILLFYANLVYCIYLVQPELSNNLTFINVTEFDVHTYLIKMRQLVFDSKINIILENEDYQLITELLSHHILIGGKLNTKEQEDFICIYSITDAICLKLDFFTVYFCSNFRNLLSDS